MLYGELAWNMLCFVTIPFKMQQYRNLHPALDQLKTCCILTDDCKLAGHSHRKRYKPTQTELSAGTRRANSVLLVIYVLIRAESKYVLKYNIGLSNK